MEPYLDLQVFGSVEVRRPDGSIIQDWVRPTGRRLLCLVALSPDRRIRREDAASALFPTAGDLRGNALAKALHWCRTALGPPWQEQLVSGAGVLHWAGPLRTDADAVLALARGTGAPADRAALTAAVGEEQTLLPGWDEDWVEDLRQEARAGVRLARRALAELLAAGDPSEREQAVTLWRRLVEDDPLDQGRQLGLLRALFATGRTEEARAATLACRQVLWAELGVLPNPDLERCWQAGSASAAPDDAPAVSVAEPVSTATVPDGHRTGTALVGRDEELARLDRALAGAESRAGGSAIVVGPAGSGKSALLEETARRWRSRGFTVAQTIAPVGGGPSHGVALALLGAVLGPTDSARLEAVLRGHPDRATPITRQEQRGAATVSAVLRALDAAVTIPTLLVVDDLHQADPASAHLISALSRGRSGRMWSLVVATRPSDTAAAHGEVIALGPLDAPDVREIVNARYPKADPDQVAVAVERSGGNPLFALELAGLLRSSSQDNPVPPSAVELLKSRLALLPPAQRLLMPIAVAAGELATRPVVTDAYRQLVAGRAREPEEVSAALDVLAAEGLLIERAGVLRPTHPLIGEAALALLARSRRAALYDALARTLTSLGLDGQSAAYHRLLAFELAPDPTRAHAAAESALDAARVALAQGRDTDAASMARYVERAWATAAAPERAQLQDHRTEALLILGHALAGTSPAQAHSVYDLGRAAAHDDDTKGRFLVAQGWMHYMHGDFSRAALSYHTGLELGELQWRTRAALLTHLGWVLARQELTEEGLTMCQEALAMARGRDDPFTEGTALDRTAMTLAFLGRTLEARQMSDEAFHVASAAGDAALLSAVQSHRGSIRGRLGDWEAALRHLDEAVQLARSVNDPYLESVAWWSRTDVLTRKGDTQVALAANSEEERCLLMTGNQVHLAACARRRRRLLGEEQRLSPHAAGPTP